MANPTPELQSAITHLHAAIATEQDPKHMATLGQCLQKMMAVQSELMQGGAGGNGGGPPPGAESGGYGGGSPPAGPQTAADPRMALMAGLGG